MNWKQFLLLATVAVALTALLIWFINLEYPLWAAVTFVLVAYGLVAAVLAGMVGFAYIWDLLE